MKKPKYTEKLVLNSGNTVYKYDEKSLALRKKKKVKRTKTLTAVIYDIIDTVSADLKSRDKLTADTAAVVALILCTYERVGNEISANNEHFGASNLEKRHVIDKGDHLVLKYIAKSGVQQEKPVYEPELVEFIKSRIKSKPPRARIFTCSASEVNNYLDEFSVTSKDLRTYAANKFMAEELKALHKISTKINLRKNPHKPELNKTQRHAVFNTALNNVSKIIGHKPATLRSMYLHDKLKNDYLNEGKI